MEKYNLAYKEGALKSQQAVSNGIDIDNVEAIDQMENSSLGKDQAVATVGQYADMYERSYKEFAGSSFMQGLVAKDGCRCVQ